MKKLYVFLFIVPILIFGQSSTSCDLSFNYDATSLSSEIIISDALPFAEDDIIGVFYQLAGEGLVCVGSFEYDGDDDIVFDIYGSSNSNGLSDGENLIYILNSGGVLYNLNVISYDIELDDPLVFGDDNEINITDIETTTFSYGINQTIINQGNTTIQTCVAEYELYTQEADSYLWSTGDTTQAITVTVTGDYTVNRTNQYGCESQSEVFIEIIEDCGGSGCGDPAACDYNPDLEGTDINNDLCTYPVQFYNCDNTCINDTDGDGVCNELEIYGCPDPDACYFGASSYNPNATEEIGCLYPITIYGYDYYDCDGICLNDTDEDGICDEAEVEGCTLPGYCNYNPGLDEVTGACADNNENGVPDCCQLPDYFWVDCDGNCADLNNDGSPDDTDGDGVCDILEDAGCTDSSACNYDASASNQCLGDNSCCEYPEDLYFSSPNSSSSNNVFPNSPSNVDCDGNCADLNSDGSPDDADSDGVCDLDEVAGCTDSTACNYNEDATDDDGGCTYVDTSINPCQVCVGNDTYNIFGFLVNQNTGDGVIEDGDSDGDGVCDGEDDFPDDADETTDSDGDGVGDNSDNCIDVENPEQEDLDEDGIGDACDDCIDVDGDGYGIGESCLGEDDFPDNSNETTDSDGDGIGDNSDNCVVVENPLQEDLDEDGIGDACDDCIDVDGDGYGIGLSCLGEDDFPNDASETTDSDGDGVGDNSDNCVVLENPLQEDLDEDGFGDICDICPNDSSNDTTYPNDICDDEDVLGCMDITGCNYNQNATFELDGSCVFVDGVCETCSGEQDGTGVIVDNDVDDDGVCDADEIAGCTDSTACNYDADPTTDTDNSLCVYVDGICETCSGETDGTGAIVDNDADDDGVCDANEITWCTDSTACNYDANPTTDTDNSLCIYVDGVCETCSGETDGTGAIVDNDADDDGVCDADEITWCTDSTACNYDADSTTDTDNSLCIYVDGVCETCSGETDGTGTIVDNDLDNDGVCDELEIAGCQAESACNYDSAATDDFDLDGNGIVEENESCQFLNLNDFPCDTCEDPDGDGISQIIDNDEDDDGICNDQDLGCIDSLACNYDAGATTDDGSCDYADDICEVCALDGEGNVIIDGSGFVVDIDDDNDGVCNDNEIGGCTNLLACNYEPWATNDNGSCVVLNVELGDTIVACENSILLDAGNSFGGYEFSSYEWSTGDTTSTINVTESGIYSITVLSQENTDLLTLCEATDSVYVNFSELLLTETHTDVSCFNGSDGSYEIIIELGGEATISTLTGLSAGSYTPQFEYGNGCFGEITVEINEPDSIFVSDIISDYTSYGVSCQGASDGSIDLTTSGGTGVYTYLWSNSATTEDISDLSAGIYSVVINDENGCISENEFEITEPTGEIVLSAVWSDYNGFGVSCFEASDGSIDITVEGGTGIYTYLWSNDETTEDISDLSAGLYSVTASDENGCSVTVEIEITEPEELTIELFGSDYNGFGVSCFGASDGFIDVAILGGTGACTYLWNNDETTEDISDLSAGLYSFTATDENECSATVEIEITEPEELAIEIVQSDYNGFGVSCFGASDGFIDVTVEGGTGVYTYLWSNDETTEDISDLSTGLYSVIATDENECSVTVEIEITEPEELTIEVVQSDYNGFGVSCFGASDGFIDVTVEGGTGVYTYLWSNDETTEDISDLSAGLYSVIATDENGCSATVEIEIAEPEELTIEIVQSDYNGFGVSCFGASDGFIDVTIFGGVGIYTYLWSNDETTEDISNLSAGLYSVTATDENGCSVTVEIETTEPEELAIEIVQSDYNGFGISCSGGDDGFIQIIPEGGTGVYTYVWSDGTNTEEVLDVVELGLILFDISAGIYTILVTDSNGCSIEEIVIEIFEPELIIISEEYSDYGEGYNISCNGASDGFINIDVTGGIGEYTYEWSNGEGVDDIENLVAGEYTLIVTDENNCESSTTINMLEPTEDFDGDGISDFCDDCPLDPGNDTMYPNGICDNEDILGCLDETACNYNDTATYSSDANGDGIIELNEDCIYLPEPVDCFDCSGDPQECYDCSGETDGSGVVLIIDSDDDGIGDCWEIPGCMDEVACNYNSTSNEDDGSCVYANSICDSCSGQIDGSGVVVDNDADDDGICDDVDPCPNDSTNDGDYPNGICDNEDVLGCSELTACNYNTEATWNDGSCIFVDGICETCSGETDGTGAIIDNDQDNDGVCNEDEIAGCQDSIACNYNEEATDDDSSCVFVDGICEVCSGETDGTGAIIDNDQDNDGVCDEDEIAGCQDSIACNYDAEVTDDDGSCVFVDNICETCSGETDGTGAIIDNDQDNDGVCDEDEIAGCQDSIACNYDAEATDSDECLYIDGICETCSGETDGTGTVEDNDQDNDGVCNEDEIAGCQDSIACNYNEEATDSDECLYIDGICETCSGETDGTGTVEDNDQDNDGVCNEDEIAGCQDSIACNYNEEATDDDGSCVFVDSICEICSGETDGTGFVLDNDQDNDGICDDEDPCPVDAENDLDDDGICGDNDNCPDLYNPNQEDADNDNIGDVCDCMIVSILGDDEVCVDDFTTYYLSTNIPDELYTWTINEDYAEYAWQSGFLEGDSLIVNFLNIGSTNNVVGIIQDCPDGSQETTYLDFTVNIIFDSDGDGICGNEDNCPDDYNYDQEDSDNDGIGDACDDEVRLDEKHMHKEPIKTINIVGKETNTNKGFQLHIYDDGSVEKKHFIK